MDLAAAAAVGGFAGHTGDGGPLDRLCGGLRRLPDRDAKQLATALMLAPGRVWMGAHTFSQQAEALQVGGPVLPSLSGI